jgi:hypothetical protein
LSFIDSIRLPPIFSLPPMYSCCASALPVHIAMKSASLSSSVHSGAAVSPWATLLALQSIVHTLAGSTSLNWNTVLALAAARGASAGTGRSR